MTIITRTRNGLRLSQHGVVISELRTSPGPTHSVFDVLAAVITVLAPRGRIGMMGFAGGGMMAPLRALGVASVIDTVDLDRAGHDLFTKHCPDWTGGVNWQQADAVAWLQQQPRAFGLLLDDLSVPQGGDVFKPDISWNVLPALIRQRLRRGGFGVFNLMPASGGNWNSDVTRIAKMFGTARIITLDEFENQILVAGDTLPTAREIGAQLRRSLRFIRSQQAGRIHVRKVTASGKAD